MTSKFEIYCVEDQQHVADTIHVGINIDLLESFFSFNHAIIVLLSLPDHTALVQF